MESGSEMVRDRPPRYVTSPTRRVVLAPKALPVLTGLLSSCKRPSVPVNVIRTICHVLKVTTWLERTIPGPDPRSNVKTSRPSSKVKAKSKMLNCSYTVLFVRLKIFILLYRRIYIIYKYTLTFISYTLSGLNSPISLIYIIP